MEDFHPSTTTLAIRPSSSEYQGMEVLAIIVALVVAFAVGKLIFSIFFDGSDDFWDCVRFSFTPDIFSLFRGEYFEDIMKSFKLSIYLLLMGGAGYLAHYGMSSFGK